MDGPDESLVPSVRPYFIPAGVDYASLPEPVRVALDEIVAPCYQDLVLGAQSSLERSAAVSLVFMLVVEVLDHFAIGRELDFSQTRALDDAAARDKAIERNARNVGAKQKAAGFLLRIQELRTRQPLFP